MRTINKLIIVLFIILNFGSSSFAENNFFEEGKNKYDEQKFKFFRYIDGSFFGYYIRDKRHYEDS